MRLATQLPEFRGGAPRRAAMDRMVQRAASASGARLPEPAPVPGATTSTCGLTAREHYTLRFEERANRVDVAAAECACGWSATASALNRHDQHPLVQIDADVLHGPSLLPCHIRQEAGRVHGAVIASGQAGEGVTRRLWLELGGSTDSTMHSFAS